MTTYLLHGLFEQVHWSAGKTSPFKKAGFEKVWLPAASNKNKSTHIGKIYLFNLVILNSPLSELRNFIVDVAL